MKDIKVRIQNKHDITENWERAVNFIPKAGEIIIYDDLHKAKVGDGIHNPNNLPFLAANNEFTNSNGDLVKIDLSTNDDPYIIMALNGGTQTKYGVGYIEHSGYNLYLPTEKDGTVALVENFKTINGQSIIGEGDIEINGGNGGGGGSSEFELKTYAHFIDFGFTLNSSSGTDPWIGHLTIYNNSDSYLFGDAEAGEDLSGTLETFLQDTLSGHPYPFYAVPYNGENHDDYIWTGIGYDNGERQHVVVLGVSLSDGEAITEEFILNDLPVTETVAEISSTTVTIDGIGGGSSDNGPSVAEINSTILELKDPATISPSTMYLTWKGSEFPSDSSGFKAPANSTIDWGDGTIETFSTASTSVTSHTYTDGIAVHLIKMTGITSIDRSAFTGCYGLTSITIGSGVTSIGDHAFTGCIYLTSVVIPDSVTSIGERAFFACQRLTSVVIPDSVTFIGSSAFSSCSGLTSIVIPDSVMSIDVDAFRDCSGLVSVVIGNDVTWIGGSAFYNCSSLTSITIPDSVTSIDDAAFAGCSGLTSVTIGNSVTSIEWGAFSGCSGLTSITIKNSTAVIPFWGDDSLEDYPNLEKIYVPAALLSNYKTASGWSAFANKIAAKLDTQVLESLFVYSDNTLTINI